MRQSATHHRPGSQSSSLRKGPRLTPAQVDTSVTSARVLPGGAMKSLLRTRQAQAMLAAVLGVYLAFALRTTRWTLDGQEHFGRTVPAPRRCLPSGTSSCR